MKQLLVELSSFDYVSCIVDSETRKVQWGKGFRDPTSAKRRQRWGTQYHNYFRKCSHPFGLQRHTQTFAFEPHLRAARREDFADLRYRYAGNFLRHAAIVRAVKSSS